MVFFSPLNLLELATIAWFFFLPRNINDIRNGVLRGVEQLDHLADSCENNSLLIFDTYGSVGEVFYQHVNFDWDKVTNRGVIPNQVAAEFLTAIGPFDAPRRIATCLVNRLLDPEHSSRKAVLCRQISAFKPKFQEFFEGLEAVFPSNFALNITLLENEFMDSIQFFLDGAKC